MIYLLKKIFRSNKKEKELPVIKDHSRYYVEKFTEIPLELFPKIKEVFDRNLDAQFKKECIDRILEFGLNEWMTPYHFTVGMGIRNLLRENGITDNLFPDGNLDDYYVVMIEWWLGYRWLR